MEVMVRNLPAQHREIIVATYFRRRTTREAAVLLGLTRDRAKARLYQAMRDLSAMVAASLPDHAGAQHRAPTSGCHRRTPLTMATPVPRARTDGGGSRRRM
jgi:RNA polymerase sigma-70 factor (ECF subfamily)